MEEKTCPQCLKQLDEKARIYKDEVCGHSKCKSCLIEEEDECKQCSGQRDHNYSNDLQQIISEEYQIIQIEKDDGYIEEEYLDLQLESDFVKDSKRDCATNYSKEESVRSTLEKSTKKDGVQKKVRISKMPHFIESILVKNDDTEKSEQRYRCNICQKVFKSSHQIKYHQYCDDSLEKPYKCDECSAEYRTGYQLKQHQQLHLNTYYECSECSRKFSHDASAKKHYKKHFQMTPISPKKTIPKGVFPCKICDKIFGRRDYLKKHMICHDEKKRFSCSQCDKVYARNNALKFHILTAHTERQEFECKCGKTFSTMQSLARHKAIHSDTKPLKCLICGLRSSRKDNIQRHIRSFHPSADPKTSFATDELDEVEQNIEIEETTTVIRSQEASLRKNVIVMQKTSDQVSLIKEPMHQDENISKAETKKPVQSSSTSSNDRSFKVTPSVHNLGNIDIYRKILLSIPEVDQHEEADDGIEEYIEHIS